MSYKDFINNFSVTPFGRWVAKTFAAKVDPFLYKVSGGKFTSTGPLTIPQLTLTTVGRKSGKERTVQLGYHEDGDEEKKVIATRLTDSEKAIVWPKIEGTIPQMKSYKVRTDRNIKVYRLHAD